MADKKSCIPILPLRSTVLFPGIATPLAVGRERSINAVQKARESGNRIIVVAQRVGAREEREPSPDHLYGVGVIAEIQRVLQSGNALNVVAVGERRVLLSDIRLESEGNYLCAAHEALPDLFVESDTRRKALVSSLKSTFKEVVDLLPEIGQSLAELVDAVEDPIQLSHLCASYLNSPTEENQRLLEEVRIERRLERLLELIERERAVLLVRQEIRQKMTERMTEAQRKALLREQLSAIREELGESEQVDKENFEQKIDEAGMPPEVDEVARRELSRLDILSPASAEYYVVRNYLEWLTELPWSKSSGGELDIRKARETLDRQHYGLDRVKNRIIQYLAVTQLKRSLRGPILCLVGAPGVGKTSIGQSVADAMGRKFARASLGGIRDEAEIRGHRRTYVGAMPGRIIQSIRQVGVNNPVMMLDEIDKLGISFQGDPAAAMLELLDPEQNSKFSDHYLGIPFDLSNVFFIATANMTDTIPPALRDRMEIIHIPGYLVSEKMHIARDYLIPKQRDEHGLREDQLRIQDDALETIITAYTREAGVRELTRMIASLCRAVAQKVVEGTERPEEVAKSDLSELLGPQRYFPEILSGRTRPGVVTGLAWTPSGGEILFVEATQMPGTGRLVLTGQLGEVMKESAQIALSIVRAHAGVLAPDTDFSKTDIHVHVPAGAIPKDGPSAGSAVLTALASLFSGTAVDPRLGMTGEITLSGYILPVGGIREKLTSAHRSGVRKALLPARNEKDLGELPDEVRSDLEIVLVGTAEELLSHALGIPKWELEQPEAA